MLTLCNASRRLINNSEMQKNSSVVVDSLLIVTPNMGFCNCYMFCCTLLYVHSSFAIILIGKRELVALLSLSSWCPVIDVWLYLAVPWVCLRFVILLFPDHKHLLFLLVKVGAECAIKGQNKSNHLKQLGPA